MGICFRSRGSFRSLVRLLLVLLLLFAGVLFLTLFLILLALISHRVFLSSRYPSSSSVRGEGAATPQVQALAAFIQANNFCDNEMPVTGSALYFTRLCRPIPEYSATANDTHVRTVKP